MKIEVRQLEASDTPGTYLLVQTHKATVDRMGDIPSTVFALSEMHGNGRYVARVDGKQAIRWAGTDTVIEYADGEALFALTTEWLEADADVAVA